MKQATSWSLRRDAARLLGQLVSAELATISDLLRVLLDRHNDVRAACAEALAQLAPRHPGQADTVAQRLVKVIGDPGYVKKDRYGQRSGQEYAYDALWKLVTGR